MTKEDIAKSIDPNFPFVYAPTTAATKLIFNDGSTKVGYFEYTRESPRLQAENKYTFIEFGEKAQRYRATRNEEYVTIIDGDNLVSVEYPSYSDTLTEKLKSLKSFSQKIEQDWDTYKEGWLGSIKDLHATIMYKWFGDYEADGLMNFSTIPVKKVDPYINEYLTMVLEIVFPNNRTIILEPVSAVTSEYNGRLDFYMRGNVEKKVYILRTLLPENKTEWVLARSSSSKDHFPLTKSSLESIISEWLQ